MQEAGEVGERTDRNHALSIVIQILKHHLTKCIHLTTPRNPAPLLCTMHSQPIVLPNPHTFLLSTQKPTLLLQPPKQPSQLPHHFSIRNPIRDRILHYYCKVKYKLIATVFPLANADRVADDAVVICAEGEEAVAELLGRDEVGGYGFEGEEGLGESGGGEGRCYAALGDLVEDAGACGCLLG